MFALAATFCFLAGPTQEVSTGDARRPEVIRIRLENEAITPVTARFIRRAIDLAEQEQAACLVIVLDTPGGLVDSTRDVVKSILGSEVPIVVYVAPSGARAASAGVFLTLASHVAVMAPGTHIGAAHPVQIGGLPGSPPTTPKGPKGDDKPATDVLKEKTVNDTVAWARSLAELRGRNVDWAERAVRESLSVPATEAAKEQVVDLLADDLDDLLRQLDGRQVRLAHGEVTLHTAGLPVRTLDMWWGERLLGVLANPNVAFLLLVFGFYGILFELYTPGWGVAGTLGVICLILGFFALAVLPVNYVGLALIIVALAMFVAEAFVTSYGFLTLGGAVCLVLGGLMLVESPGGFQQVSLWILVPIAFATATITFVLVGSIVKTHRQQAQTGSEALVGATAIAEEDFLVADGRYDGMVRTHGELWKATTTAPVQHGQVVEVEDRQGLTLRVRIPVAPEPASGARKGQVA